MIKMLNMTLFKRTIKSNYKLILIFIAILTMYFFIIAGMYDPDNLDIVNMLAEMKLSPELLAAMGFTLTDTSLLGFISSYFYGLLMLAFPMICYIIIANKLIAGYVDRGSMAYILSSPNTRKKVSLTQATFLIVAIMFIIGVMTGLGIIFCELKFPGMLDIGTFLLINLGVMLLHLAISGICFFSSCVFNESRLSLLFGAGLPILFLLIQMISNSSKDLEIFKYFTIFSLFNTTNILSNDGWLVPFIVLFAIGAVLYSAGIAVFCKKDLPI